MNNVSSDSSKNGFDAILNHREYELLSALLKDQHKSFKATFRNILNSSCVNSQSISIYLSLVRDVEHLMDCFNIKYDKFIF